MKIPESKRKEIMELAHGAFFENIDIADFIWKSKNLIDHEWGVEKEKLRSYFAPGSEIQMERYRRESRKIHSVFPTLINNSNLIMALSLHETRFMLLCKMLEPHSSKKLKEYKGNGLKRFLEFLKSEYAIQYEKSEAWELASSALTIRNCIVHSFGIIDHSRDKEEIRQIIKAKRYLEKDQRKNGKPGLAEIKTITKDLIGDQIMIGSYYPWLVTGFLMDLFIHCCEGILGQKVIRHVDQDGNEVDPKEMRKRMKKNMSSGLKTSKDQH
jgi:hypothetical protein